MSACSAYSGLWKSPTYCTSSATAWLSPQYEASSGARFERIAQLEERYPGLHLAGAIRDGIGIPDRIKQGEALARLISKQHGA